LRKRGLEAQTVVESELPEPVAGLLGGGALHAPINRRPADRHAQNTS
jgi:hypothetical protein